MATAKRTIKLSAWLKVARWVMLTIATFSAAVVMAQTLNQTAKKKPKTVPNAKDVSQFAPPETSVIDSLQFVEGDEEANEVKAIKTEMMVARTELKAIEQAQKLIKKYRGTNIEPDLQFRLAELYMRRAKTARFFEINRQSDTAVRLIPQVVSNASSRKWVEQAIGTYDLIQKRFPRFHQLDMIVFNSAFARQQLARDNEAERLYLGLIKNFPQSNLVPDSYLALGEINFERKQFEKALEHFNAIENYRESKVYPYGLYKAAWAHYNMRRADRALAKLEEVVAYGRFVFENKIEARLDLRKEALADMTLFYEDVRPAKEAFAYFKKQAAELDVSPVILKLAKLYEHHARYHERLVVLEDYIKNMPESVNVAEIHQELILNYDSMKQKNQAVEQMEKLAALCKEGSRWLSVQRKAVVNMTAENDPRRNCVGLLNEVSLRLASRWLNIWKKNPTYPDFADAAEKSFAIYLREPGESKEAYESRYVYAELLFQRLKYRLASEQYALVGNSNFAGDNRHDANYGAIVSLEKAVGEKWSDSDEKLFNGHAKTYLQNNPKGKYRLDVEFKSALIAYDKNRYDEAAPVFLRLGRDFSAAEKGKKAQDLYLDILNLKKDYKNLKEYSAQVLQAESDSTRRAKLQKIHEQAYFLQIQSLEATQQLALAITEYKNFATKNSRSDLAEKSWWNAMQLHFKTLDYMGGAKAAEEYVERFPTAKNSLEALLKAAQSYEALAQLENAANVLIKVAKADHASAAKWQSLAIDFYLLSGKGTKAKGLLAEMRKAKDAKTQVQALEKLMLIDKQNNNIAGYTELRKAMIQLNVQPQASLAKVEVVEEMYKAGKVSDAFNEAKKVVGMDSASPFAKSRARMIQAKVLESEFLQQSVKAKAEKLATVLAIKTEKLERVQQAYQQAIKYGEPHTAVEAMRRLGGCYLHYVDSLKNMPMPAELAAGDVETLRQELANLVIPIEEKAIETLQQGFKLSQRVPGQDKMSEEIKMDLKKLNMPVATEDHLRPTELQIMLPQFGGLSS